jgi:hypothetical protein
MQGSTIIMTSSRSIKLDVVLNDVTVVARV